MEPHSDNPMLRYLGNGNGHGPPPGNGNGINRQQLVLFRPLNTEQQQAAQLCRQHTYTFLTGPTGTAKTHVALAVALEALQAARQKKIVLIRPQVEAGERMGFLPGDIAEKLQPWLAAFADVLPRMSFQSPEKLLQELVEAVPLSHMRGRSFHRALVILDEAQNCSPAQLWLALSRLGERSRMILTGDDEQCDLVAPPCLEAFARRLHGLRIRDEEQEYSVAWMRLTQIVRNPLIQQMHERVAPLLRPSERRSPGRRAC